MREGLGQLNCSRVSLLPEQIKNLVILFSKNLILKWVIIRFKKVISQHLVIIREEFQEQGDLVFLKIMQGSTNKI